MKMLHISKDDGDKILEQFFINASKVNGGVRCAEESFKIMADFFDSHLVLSILIDDKMRAENKIPSHITEFEIQLLSALTTAFSFADKECIPLILQELFEGSDDEIFEKVKSNRKLKYAVANFISSILHYDYFESKYPEISKMI